MKALILAAGRGSRLGADNLPKPLWEIGPRSLTDSTPITLLERQIHCLRAAGVQDVGVVVGWQREQVMARVGSLGVTFVVNDHPTIAESGTSHSLQYAALSPWNPFDGSAPLLLLDGDLAYESAVMRSIVSDSQRGSRLFVNPFVHEDSEEVRVYRPLSGSEPTLLGKGLRSPLTDGLQLLGEATGIVRFDPEDHPLVRSLLTWLVGIPGQSRGHSYARISSEHEELAQYLMILGRLSATVLPSDLLFMEVDFREEFETLRNRVYPDILLRDGSA